MVVTIILSGPIPWVSMVPQESPLRRNPSLVNFVSSLESKATLSTRSRAHNNNTLDRLRTSSIPFSQFLRAADLKVFWQMVAVKACCWHPLRRRKPLTLPTIPW